MATVQGPIGKIEIFEDFVGAEVPIALTNAYGNIGSLRVIGDGLAETDSGIVGLDSDGVNGVAQFTTTNEDKHAIGVSTSTMFDVGNMGTIIAEARVRLPAIANREVFFGFSDVNTDTVSLEDDVFHGNGTTITLTASDGAGFLFCSELTDSADWHGIYAGGTTTGETTSTNVDLDDIAVAGEFQILRLEIAENGTCRWYIDGELKQTKTGAVSTTVDLACQLIVEAKTTTALTMDVDYFYVSAARDFTI
jgi:hypothetical protein|tara:strand:- start:31 stop:780 length:750 start_codon:yes stop_codon:yes gene_type:complete